MPFTMTNFQPPTREQSSPFANLLGNAIGSYMRANNARYQPQMIQADIFSKEASPLATLASNPFVWATMNDNQKAALSNAMGNLMQSIQGGNPGIFGQSSTSSQINNTGNSMGGGQANNASVDGTVQPGSSSQPTGGNQANYNPALPQAGQGLGVGITQKVTAPWKEQAHAPGRMFFDVDKDGNVKTYSQPTESTIAAGQNSINAIQRVLPRLNRIADESEEFLKRGGARDLFSSKVSSGLSSWGVGSPETYKKIGIDVDQQSRYQKWVGDISAATESLMSSFPNIPHTDDSFKAMQSIMAPIPGENAQGYKKRILGVINELSNEQVPALKQQIGAPIDVTSQNGISQPGNTNFNADSVNQPSQQQNTNPVSDQLRNNNAPSKGAVLLAKSMKVPNFGSKQEFQDWFNRQPSVVQDALKIKLGNK